MRNDNDDADNNEDYSDDEHEVAAIYCQNKQLYARLADAETAILLMQQSQQQQYKQ
jgi:hypothetical protein